MIDFQNIYFATALAGFLAASYTDIKTHEINPIIPKLLIALGLILHSTEAYLTQSLSPLTLSVGTMMLAFAFSYFLYLIGGWAGGDVKIFTALGAILPAYGKFNFFPFYALAASLLAIFPFILLYVSYHLLFVKGIYKKSKKIIIKAIKQSIATPFILLAGYVIASSIGYPLLSFLTIPLLYFLKKPGLILSLALTIYSFNANFYSSLIQFSLFFWMSFLTIVFFSFFEIAKKHILRETKKISELKEGDILAKNLVKQKNRHVFKENSIFKNQENVVIFAGASGLEKKDIAFLKKLGFKKIELKKSIPFVPIFTLGLIILWLIQTLLY